MRLEAQAADGESHRVKLDWVIWRPSWNLSRAKEWYQAAFDKYQASRRAFQDEMDEHYRNYTIEARTWEIMFLSWAWQHKDTDKTTAII